MIDLDDIKKQIIILQELIIKEQSECSHPKFSVTEKYRGDSGNYDPTLDRYWIEFHCTKCDKRWDKNQ